MKTEMIRALTEDFESHSKRTENGTEFWLARDLQRLLGYFEWRNFKNTVVSRARTACDISGHETADHFVEVTKAVREWRVLDPERSRRISRWPGPRTR